MADVKPDVHKSSFPMITVATGVVKPRLLAPTGIGINSGAHRALDALHLYSPESRVNVARGRSQRSNAPNNAHSMKSSHQNII